MPLTISARSLGSRKPLFEDWSIPVDPGDFAGDRGDGGLTLRDLIVKIVHAEVAAYAARREARRLDRVLSKSQIDAQAAAGRVAPEGREGPAAPDPDDAAADALAGFEDGLYVVAVDGREARRLDEQVHLTSDSRVTFIRLVFLAGA